MQNITSRQSTPKSKEHSKNYIQNKVPPALFQKTHGPFQRKSPKYI